MVGEAVMGATRGACYSRSAAGAAGADVAASDARVRCAAQRPRKRTACRLDSHLLHTHNRAGMPAGCRDGCVDPYLNISAPFQQCHTLKEGLTHACVCTGKGGDHSDVSL